MRQLLIILKIFLYVYVCNIKRKMGNQNAEIINNIIVNIVRILWICIVICSQMENMGLSILGILIKLIYNNCWL